MIQPGGVEPSKASPRQCLLSPSQTPSDPGPKGALLVRSGQVREGETTASSFPSWVAQGWLGCGWLLPSERGVAPHRRGSKAPFLRPARRQTQGQIQQGATCPPSPSMAGWCPNVGNPRSEPSHLGTPTQTMKAGGHAAQTARHWHTRAVASTASHHPWRVYWALFGFAVAAACETCQETATRHLSAPRAVPSAPSATPLHSHGWVGCVCPRA